MCIGDLLTDSEAGIFNRWEYFVHTGTYDYEPYNGFAVRAAKEL